MGCMKLQINVCGIHYVKDEPPHNLREADEVEPFKLAVGDQKATVYVCAECRPAMAASLHRMLMGGGIAAEDTGMLAYMEDHQGDEEEALDGEDTDDSGDYADEYDEWEEDEEEEDDDLITAEDGSKSRTGLSLREVREAVKNLGPVERVKAVQNADNQLIPLEDDEEEAEAVRAEVAAKRPKSQKSTPKAGTSDTKVIREWAKANNIPVPTRGRLPATIIEQYKEAHNPA